MPDTPGQVATGRDTSYELTIDEAASLYARAGQPRTPRRMASRTAAATSAISNVSIRRRTWTNSRLPLLPIPASSSRRSVANSSGNFQSASGAA